MIPADNFSSQIAGCQTYRSIPSIVRACIIYMYSDIYNLPKNIRQLYLTRTTRGRLRIKRSIPLVLIVLNGSFQLQSMAGKTLNPAVQLILMLPSQNSCTMNMKSKLRQDIFTNVTTSDVCFLS